MVVCGVRVAGACWRMRLDGAYEEQSACHCDIALRGEMASIRRRLRAFWALVGAIRKSDMVNL